MTDELMAQAEKHIQLFEDSGLPYETLTEKRAATLQIYGELQRKAKQAQIPEAASASEGGGVVGGEDESLEALNEQMAKLSEGRLTADKIKKRQAIRKKVDALIGYSDLTQVIDGK